jgi:hypothetical protein
VSYSKSDLVEVQSFTRQGDGEEVVIGLPVFNTFIALPVEAVEILDSLSRGKTVGEAQAEFARSHGIEPDIEDLLESLEQRGFVRPQGSEAADRRQIVAGNRAKDGMRYHFSGLPQSVAKRFFEPLPMGIYLATIVAAVLVAIAHPGLIPGRGSLVFWDHRTVKIVTLALITYLTVFLHELAHLLAGKARGIDSRIGLGNRLWILVAETDMTGLWGIAPRERYLPLLAGPLLDGFSAAVLFLLLYARSEGFLTLPRPLADLANAMVFLYLLRLLWQCFFFVRTDFYYVFTNFFGCKSLMQDTRDYVKNLALRAIGAPSRTDQSHIPLRERRVIKSYSLLWALGHAAAFLSLFLITLPVLFQYLYGAFLALRQGAGGNLYQYLDSILVGMLNLVPLVLGGSLWITSILRRRRAL